MCVKTSNWIFYLVMFNLNIRATAVRLYPCASSGYRDVMENSTVTFHCDQYSGGVEWRYRGPQSVEFVPISMCTKTHCTASFVPLLTSTYISAGNSSLTTTLTSRNVSFACGEYMCDNNRCRMHIIASVRPSQPKISCPTCPVPENSTVTCTCSTDNFGQPVGRLVWYTGTNGVFDREIVRGNFEFNRLTMTWTVTRSDHNVTMFRCVNEWTENFNSLTDFTAIVKGDAPSSSERRRSSNTISNICDEANTPGEDVQSVIIIAVSIGWGATVVCVVIVVVIKRQRKGAAKERSRTQSFKPSVQHNVVRSDVSIIARTAGESRDNPSVGAYESLQSADVGQTSVYSEMTHGSGPVYGNSATPKQ